MRCLIVCGILALAAVPSHANPNEIWFYESLFNDPRPIAGPPAGREALHLGKVTAELDSCSNDNRAYRLNLQCDQVLPRPTSNRVGLVYGDRVELIDFSAGDGSK